MWFSSKAGGEMSEVGLLPLPKGRAVVGLGVSSRPRSTLWADPVAQFIVCAVEWNFVLGFDVRHGLSTGRGASLRTHTSS